MMLVVIAKTQYEVCAITGADEVDAVALEFLVGAPPNMRASAIVREFEVPKGILTATRPLD